MTDSQSDKNGTSCDLNLDRDRFITRRIPKKALHVLDLTFLFDFARIEAFANQRRFGFPS